MQHFKLEIFTDFSVFILNYHIPISKAEIESNCNETCSVYEFSLQIKILIKLFLQFQAKECIKYDLTQRYGTGYSNISSQLWMQSSNTFQVDLPIIVGLRCVNVNFLYGLKTVKMDWKRLFCLKMLSMTIRRFMRWLPIPHFIQCSLELFNLNKIQCNALTN